MGTIIELEWDSHFFNLKIGKLFSNEHDRVDINKIREKVVNEDYDLVYLFSQNKIEAINPVDLKITYICYTSQELENEDLISEFKGLPELLYELAYQAGHKSRFKIDDRIPDNEYKRLYRLWIDNSVNRSFADYVKVYWEDAKPVGFITAKKDINKISIGLIAVDNDNRGKGIGKKLMASIMAIGAKENLPVEVSTQAANIGACRFYESLGFIVKEKSYIYHFWNTKR